MKTVVVLGIRSGSSLITMMLDALGVYMGKDFRTPTEFNERGYWENVDFDELNHLFFTEMGKNRWIDQPKYADVMGLPFSVARKAKEVLEKNEKEPIWGFKQPDTCFTLPIFQAWLKNPFYIIMTRNLGEQAHSISRMESPSYPKLKISDFERAIQGYMDSAMMYTSRDKRYVLDYDELLAHPKEALKVICEFLGIKPNQVQIKKALALVDPKLRTYKEDGK